MAKAHRERYRYLQKKKARELEKARIRERKEQGLPPEEKEKSLLRELLGWLFYIVLIIALTYGIITYVGQRTRVSGNSMLTTLHDNDNLIVDKISYRLREPKRFEIIVFPYQYGENTYYIKRIIGMPGETVQIIDGYVYIDGEKLEESYGMEVMNDPGIAEDPIELGRDEYFVLGDNRNNSSDSRSADVGVIEKENIVGRAWIRIWPLDSIGVVVHE